MKESKKFSVTDLLLFIVTAQLAGTVSALVSGGFSGFYLQLEKPPLSPPAWVFPVVWTILYTLMGISAYMIYSSGNDDREKALAVYWIQLGVNFLWSIVFFRFMLLNAAVAVIIALLILIAVMIKLFRDIRSAAGYINIPYLAWVAFAAYLNIAFAILN